MGFFRNAWFVGAFHSWVCGLVVRDLAVKQIPIGILPAFLILFYGFGLVGSFSLGKMVAVSVVGLWLALGKARWKPSVWPLAYLVFVLFSAVFAVDPWLSVWGLQGTYSTGVLSALALVPFWVFIGNEHRSGWEQGIRWGGVICAAIGLGQLLGIWVPFPLPEGSRVYSTMGSPVYLGALLVLAFPLLGSNFERVIVLACLVATRSRGAWLALVAGQLYKYWDGLEEWQRKSVLFGAAVVGAGLLFLRPDSDKGRLLVWDAAVEAWNFKPWLGFGTGNFLVISELWHNPDWDKVYGPIANTQDHAHNLFLEAASTGGNLTLLALCSMLWHFWKVSDHKTRISLVGVFVVGMLNPLPLVVKALVISLVASNIKAEKEIPSTPFLILAVNLICAVSVLIHWDVMMGVHGVYPWSSSSVDSAVYSGAVRAKPDFAVKKD